MSRFEPNFSLIDTWRPGTIYYYLKSLGGQEESEIASTVLVTALLE